MNDKIKELTESIYSEGVTKAREEAAKILEEANDKAKQIVLEATRKAESSIENAKKEADKINKSLKEELQTASEQVISITKQELSDDISGKISGMLSSEIIASPELISQLAIEVLKNWQEKGGNGGQAEILIPEASREKLESLIKSKAGKILDGGVVVKPVAGLQSGFSFMNTSDGFRLSFSDEDFKAFFHALIKPKLKQYLY